MRERDNGLPEFIGADSSVYEVLHAAYSVLVRGSGNRFLNRELPDSDLIDSANYSSQCPENYPADYREI